MRALIASTSGAGHYTPLVPFVEALTGRGDDVLVVGPPGLAAVVEAAGHRFRGGADPPAEELEAIRRRLESASLDEAAVLVNRERFGRLGTAAMLPALQRACDEWRPAVIVRDPCDYASAVVADRAGIPHAQVAISLARVEASSLALAAPVLEPHRAGIVERIRASPYLTRFPGSLDPSPFPLTVRYREDADAHRRPLPAWWGADDRPLIYATLGSITGTRAIAEAAYRAVIDAVAGVPARVLLTLGRDIDARTLGPLPANVHVETWVPQDDVLPHATMVVCHGGLGNDVRGARGRRPARHPPPVRRPAPERPARRRRGRRRRGLARGRRRAPGNRRGAARSGSSTRRWADRGGYARRARGCRRARDRLGPLLWCS